MSSRGNFLGRNHQDIFHCSSFIVHRSSFIVHRSFFIVEFCGSGNEK